MLNDTSPEYDSDVSDVSDVSDAVFRRTPELTTVHRDNRHHRP